MDNKDNKKINNNLNDINQDRAEWNKEWSLEKQTEGLDKKAVEKQERIGKSLENEKKEGKENGRQQKQKS
ncbi:hypothetical protein [Candidatus Babela massiliensis]|uniref:Uncharacterized protein n=1 Tax=Candidatus Babela massiliensis TaxID=673862 RepID=V6DEY4_9BACT|nr:hypothetical protein [Candidatus Babela massiliensis]CDK30140.1 hypothetical protein BABL1_gene_834 [Candidatus Babela massiliensis]